MTPVGHLAGGGGAVRGSGGGTPAVLFLARSAGERESQGRGRRLASPEKPKHPGWLRRGRTVLADVADAVGSGAVGERRRTARCRPRRRTSRLRRWSVRRPAVPRADLPAPGDGDSCPGRAAGTAYSARTARHRRCVQGARHSRYPGRRTGRVLPYLRTPGLRPHPYSAPTMPEYLLPAMAPPRPGTARSPSPLHPATCPSRPRRRRPRTRRPAGPRRRCTVRPRPAPHTALSRRAVPRRPRSWRPEPKASRPSTDKEALTDTFVRWAASLVRGVVRQPKLEGTVGGPVSESVARRPQSEATVGRLRSEDVLWWPKPEGMVERPEPGRSGPAVVARGRGRTVVIRGLGRAVVSPACAWPSGPWPAALPAPPPRPVTTPGRPARPSGSASRLSVTGGRSERGPRSWSSGWGRRCRWRGWSRGRTGRVGGRVRRRSVCRAAPCGEPARMAGADRRVRRCREPRRHGHQQHGDEGRDRRPYHPVHGGPTGRKGSAASRVISRPQARRPAPSRDAATVSTVKPTEILAWTRGPIRSGSGPPVPSRPRTPAAPPPLPLPARPAGKGARSTTTVPTWVRSSAGATTTPVVRRERRKNHENSRALTRLPPSGVISTVV